MKNIVVIGGGSGTFNVLRGLKHYPVNITAIVTTFDNGGSTGILRDEFGMLPSGDIRRALVALAPDTGDSTLRDLFTYRFSSVGSLGGHSFGNLFLKALGSITGSELGAIKKASSILNIKGTVLPVSIDDSHLCALLEDGQIIKGETNIDVPKHDGSVRVKNVYLEPKAYIYEEAYEAIVNADMILIGPGDLYSSLIPNILVEGFVEAVKKSKGKIIYVLNIMTKWGETNSFRASDFVSTLLKYLGRKNVDYIICNKAKVRTDLIEKYEKEKASPVLVDEDELKKYATNVIVEDVINESDIVRHDSKKLSRILLDLK